MNKIDDAQVSKICMSLFDDMIGCKEESQRDVACLGLKTVISEMDGQNGRSALLARVLEPRLKESVSSENDELASNGCGLLLQLMSEHGATFDDMSGMVELMIAELQRQRPGIRKLALQCLGILFVALPVHDFNANISILMDMVGKERHSPERANTFVQAVAHVCKSAGARMHGHIHRILPLVIDITKMLDDESYINVLESGLVLMDICVAKCPKATHEYLKDMCERSTLCLAYDPNYAAGSDIEQYDETDNDMDTSDDEEVSDGDEYDEEEDAYSDDDDSSWKVRRAACKLISALIKQYPQNLADLFDCFNKNLVKRFDDREETVRNEIFQAYWDLVTMMHARDNGQIPDRFVPAVEKAIKKLLRQLKGANTKTKIWIYRILTQSVKMVPHMATTVVSKVLKDLQVSVDDDSSSALQVEALEFVEFAFSAMDKNKDNDFAVKLADIIFSGTRKRYFAVAASALKSCLQLILFVRPKEGPVPEEMAGMIMPLFSLLTEALSNNDRPQEVKNASIEAASLAVARLGDLLGSDQVEDLAQDFAAMPKNRNAKRAKLHDQESPIQIEHPPRLQEVRVACLAMFQAPLANFDGPHTLIFLLAVCSIDNGEIK